MNRINQYIKTVVGGIQQERWNFYYGPTGIDKVTRTQGGIQNLSMDFSTDSRGRILSMNYNEVGGYSGELFAIFDNFGNLADLIDVNGLSKWTTIYDLNNRYKDELWRQPNLDVPLGWNGKNGDITIQVGTDKDLIIDAEGSDFSITNPWGATDDQGFSRPPKTNKGGGDGDRLCGTCPPGYVWTCVGFYTAECAMVINGQNVRVLFTITGDPRGNESTVESEIEHTCPNGKKVKAKLRKTECSCKPEPYAF